MRKNLMLISSVSLLLVSQVNAQDGEQRDFRYQISVHGIYMVPDGVQATDYSRPGFGGGATFIFPLGSIPAVMRGGGGIEVVSLLSKSKEFQDATTGFPVEQDTKQSFFRIYGGLHVGGAGRAFLRPYSALNLALNFYSINSDYVITDSYDPSKQVRKNIRSDIRVVMGFDMTFGLDLNVAELWSLDGGFRYVKSFGVPQQLGEGSVTIYPYYFQVFIGIRGQGLLSRSLPEE